MKNKEPKFRYEIAVPVKETLFFYVDANSEEEAIEKYNEHDHTVEQSCSIGGWPYGPKIKVIGVLDKKQ